MFGNKQSVTPATIYTSFFALQAKLLQSSSLIQSFLFIPYQNALSQLQLERCI